MKKAKHSARYKRCVCLLAAIGLLVTACPASFAVELSQNLDTNAFMKYEAEHAAITGGAFFDSNHANFSGTGFVSMIKVANYASQNAAIGFYFVNGGQGGRQEIKVCYDNGHGVDQMLSAYVNGALAARLSCPTVEKDVWNKWGVVSFYADLLPGVNNTIVLQYEDEDEGCSFNIDYIAVPKTAPQQTVRTAVIKAGEAKVWVQSGGASFYGYAPAAPVNENGTTLVAINPLFSLMGLTATDNTVSSADKTVQFTAGADKALLNGEETLLPASVRVQNGTLLVPLRFVCESFGLSVNWNAETGEISVCRQDIL